MRIAWSKRAEAEFDAALTYLEQRSPAGAKRIGAQIKHSILLLGEFPNSAPESRHKGLRQRAVPSTRYIVVYRVKAEHVEIRAIIHASQRRRR